jgi:hypothetical protein
MDDIIDGCHRGRGTSGNTSHSQMCWHLPRDLFCKWEWLNKKMAPGLSISFTPKSMKKVLKSNSQVEKDRKVTQRSIWAAAP